MSTIFEADILLAQKNQQWFNDNSGLVLKWGQMVFLVNTGRYKIGNGSTTLAALPFYGVNTALEQRVTDLENGLDATTIIADSALALATSASSDAAAAMAAALAAATVAPSSRVLFGTGTGYSSSVHLKYTTDVFGNPTLSVGDGGGVSIFGSSYAGIQGVGFNDFKILGRNSSCVINLSVFGDITYSGTHSFVGGAFNVNTGQTQDAISIATNGSITFNPNNAVVTVKSYLVPDKIGKAATDSIILSETNSSIIHGSIGFESIANNAILNWYGKLKIGTQTPLSDFDINIAKSVNGIVGISITNPYSTGFTGSVVYMGQSSSDYSQIARWSPTATNNLTGTNLTFQDALHLVNNMGGGVSNGPIYIQGNPLIHILGNSSSNMMMRHDSVGVRIGIGSTIGNSNTVMLQVGTQFIYDDTSGLNLSTPLEVSATKVKFSSLPTSPAGLSAGELWNNLGIVNIV
jgi:hypothetical protein